MLPPVDGLLVLPPVVPPVEGLFVLPPVEGLFVLSFVVSLSSKELLSSLGSVIFSLILLSFITESLFSFSFFLPQAVKKVKRIKHIINFFFICNYTSLFFFNYIIFETKKAAIYATFSNLDLIPSTPINFNNSYKSGV